MSARVAAALCLVAAAVGSEPEVSAQAGRGECMDCTAGTICACSVLHNSIISRLALWPRLNHMQGRQRASCS